MSQVMRLIEDRCTVADWTYVFAWRMIKQVKTLVISRDQIVIES